MNGVPAWHRGRSTAVLMALPVPLAWLSSCLLSGGQARPAPPSADLLWRLLLWGPLLETALLLLAVLAVSRWALRHQRRGGTGMAATTLIVGMSFLAAHWLQAGVAALASAPMALLMAGVAAQAVLHPAYRTWAARGGLLFAMHALYNGAVLCWM